MTQTFCCGFNLFVFILAILIIYLSSLTISQCYLLQNFFLKPNYTSQEYMNSSDAENDNNFDLGSKNYSSYTYPKGKATEIDCAPGFSWNHSMGGCVNSTAMNLCKNKHNIIIKNPNSINTYIHCAFGKEFIMNCPLDYVWNDIKKVCQEARQIKTDLKFRQSRTMKGEIKAPNYCKHVQSFEKMTYPDPLDCSSYFMCANQKPLLTKCPDTQIYDPENGLCTEISRSTCFKPCENISASQTALMANPHDCKSFLQCINGHPVKQICPSLLVWVQNKCEWPADDYCTNIHISIEKTYLPILPTENFTSYGDNVEVYDYSVAENWDDSEEEGEGVILKK